MWEINSILQKYKKTLDLYNEFENTLSKTTDWHELRNISIDKLIRNEDIDEVWIKKAEGLIDAHLPLEACLTLSKYLNKSNKNINLNDNIDIYLYNTKIIDILYSKIHFNLPGNTLLMYIKTIVLDESHKYKKNLLTRKFSNLKKIKLKDKIVQDSLLGIRVKNISKIEVMYYTKDLDNYVYVDNEDIEIIDIMTGDILIKYKKDSKSKRLMPYTTVLSTFYIQNREINIENKYERMLLYEVVNQIYSGNVSSGLKKEILRVILDNKDLFEKECIDRIIEIANVKNNVNTVKYINELIKQPSNNKIISIIAESENIEEIFSVLKQAEEILKEEIRSDVYIEAISKCYEIVKNEEGSNLSKTNIALYCEELISQKPIIFTEVIDILKEMYKEKIFTNKTIDTLKYIKHTVKDEKIIDDILFHIKYENCEFDNEFIQKISELDKSSNKSDILFIDKVLNKLVYNEKDISKYSKELPKLMYKFYKRNNDLNTLHNLCEFRYKNDKSILVDSIIDNDIVNLLNFYKKNKFKLDVGYELDLINKYAYNKDILSYGELVVQSIYVNKDKKGIDLLKKKYKNLLKLLRKNSTIIYEEYLKMLESGDKKLLHLSELSNLDEEEIIDIKNILNRRSVHSSTKLYMLKILINYYITKLDKEKILYYMNNYITGYAKSDNGELFKNILYNQWDNIEFIEIILNNLDFNSIPNADLFMSIISKKLENSLRIDLLPEILRYYIANEKYEESVSILKMYISKNIKVGNIIKQVNVQIDELSYEAFIIPILENVDSKFKIDIYKLLLYREDLPIDIREKYFNLIPSKENKEKIIDSFALGETKSELAKEFALEAYYEDDDEFCKLVNIGEENSKKILELIYSKARKNFKDNKDYVNKLIKNIYKQDDRLYKIYKYIQSYNENFFDRKAQNIFGEYVCTLRNQGEFIDKLYLTNIFDESKLEAIGFTDEDYKVDTSILNYLDKIKVNYYKLDENVILLNENNNLSFLEEGNILLFIENIKALIKLQTNLILNERMMIEFREDTFIINEKGFIPNSFKYICKYSEEFRTRDMSAFENTNKISTGKYVTINEKNICILIKLYVKNILNQVTIDIELNHIKENFILEILENISIVSYENFLECIDMFIEKESKTFENITYKEKLKIFDDLDELEKYEVINYILLKRDTSLIAKKIVLNCEADDYDIDLYVSYLIDCFNNFNLGFNTDDYLKIYDKINDNIISNSEQFYSNMKNEIFNFYINAKDICKIHSNDIKDDVNKLKISDDDKEYLNSRI